MNQVVKNYYDQRNDYGINRLRRKKINSLVQNEINQGNKYILDLGCASGYLAGAWRENNYLIGADIAQQPIVQAKNILNEAYLFDLESADWPLAITNKKFDIILCAEILEYLFNPQDFLLKLKKLLNLNGYLIITTPNFLVWHNRWRMVLDQYGAKELFNDYGHIHLFSYNSLQKLLHQVSLKIIGENNLWHPNYLEKFAKILPPNLFVYQAILKVKPVR